MIFRIVFVTIILILVISSAASAENLQALKLEIPKTSWEPIYFETINKRTREASLRDLRTTQLEKGSVEIRIWIGFGLSWLEGIILTRENGKSEVRHIPAEYVTKIFKYSKPKSGWENFWRMLLNKKIYRLPDSSTITDYKNVFDGVSYVVEYNREGHYRTYQYNNPKYQTCPEAKQILNLSLIHI